MTYRGLEDAFIAPISLRRLLHFSLCSLWVHNTVLSCDLLPVSSFVLSLLLSVQLQLVLKAALELLDLSVLDLVATATSSINLKLLDLVANLSVLDLGFGHKAFKL